MCKEMLVIPVNRVVDMKKIIGKMEGQGGGEAQGVADPPPKKNRIQFKSVTIPVLVAGSRNDECTNTRDWEERRWPRDQAYKHL
jgi:hypothetical protein